MEKNFRIGISSCLLGNEVRWNSGHKLDKYLTRTLGQFVDYVPVCPEVEAGFGVPRESFRLVGDPDTPRLVTFKSKTDHTDRMVAWAGKRVKELEKEDLCGFVFKNVLQHLMGYFKKQLNGDEKQELLEVFDQYRNEYVPLLVPMTLINHYVRKYDQPYLKQQTYLNPHPLELKLRTHV